ncbi:MAG: serine/threonine-protein kinase [Planctomycetota bacterium]
MSFSDLRKTTTQRFRRTYAEDRRTGRRRQLMEYLELFPGDDVTVAEEYVSFERSLAGLAIEEPGTKVAGFPSRIGPYQLRQEIGRGGQGRVFRAEDLRLGREVALKILNLSAGDAEEVLLRFRREAEVTSKLDHHGLCPIHEADTADGFAYIAMPLLEGETIAERIRRQRIDALIGDEDYFEVAGESDNGADALHLGPKSRDEIREAVIAVEAAARAIHAAHEAGIVHRDLKPGNIMLTEDGRTVVLDFGLARRLEDARHALTHTGELYGSPAYASPESLQGNLLSTDRSSDIWSLGVTLFECLAWRRPFRAASREALVEMIRHEEPESLRELNPKIPTDLKIIVETAMAKIPDRRYATALEFADDLRRFLSYEPIQARPAGPLLRFRHWCRRRPLTAASLVGAWFLLCTSLFLTSWFLNQKADDASELANAISALQRENTAKHAALRALEHERAAKEAFFDLALDALVGDPNNSDEGEPELPVHLSNKTPLR